MLVTAISQLVPVNNSASNGEKADFRKKFDKIIDIQYAPEELEKGDKKFAKPKAKEENKTED